MENIWISFSLSLTAELLYFQGLGWFGLLGSGEASALQWKCGWLADCGRTRTAFYTKPQVFYSKDFYFLASNTKGNMLQQHLKL